MRIASLRRLFWQAVCIGVGLACLDREAKAQYYGPYNMPVPRPYNPYLPYTPGQQRGWQDARIYEQYGVLPRFMSPNEARTFEYRLMRDGFAPVPMQPVVPMQPFSPYPPFPGFRPF